MDIPIEVIKLILSYIPKKKCFRCNKNISVLNKNIKCNNNIFCSTHCVDYQHY